MREEWKGSIVFNSWYRVFIIQGFFLALVSLSIIAANNSVSNNINTINIIGLFIWLF